jgi:serine/threonine-protein kinase
MPGLDNAVVEDLNKRLQIYLLKVGGYDSPVFVKSGGSAAVFKASGPVGLRAIKVFDPRFLCGPNSSAERRRLDLQRRLIGHSCPNLVQIFKIEESEETAFVEMEFIPWPQLNESLDKIGDEDIPLLIVQLVRVVRFLEGLDIVHRDIKPENIHISPDFKHLKLLDLGVARLFGVAEGEEAAITDHHQLRPFVATAQYSSPEYLFRLDEPTPRLWKGLNFYQIGAVLHDLIMKRALFQYEVGLNNRWLVARSVLTTTPSFTTAQPERLASLKALASRCLTKDLDARLRLVDWSDFALEDAAKPLDKLKGRLLKADLSSFHASSVSTESRIEFERREFERRFIDRVRSELIDACGTKLPLSVHAPTPEGHSIFEFSLAVPQQLLLHCTIAFEWLSGLYARTANVRLAGYIIVSEAIELPKPTSPLLVSVTTINEAEEQAMHLVSSGLATLVNAALDRIESSSNLAELHGCQLDLMSRRAEAH